MDSGATLRTVCVAEAMSALKDGDADTHNALLATAASALEDCDAVMLAHFSTSRAFDAVSSVLRCPVLTSPANAVQKLRSALV